MHSNPFTDEELNQRLKKTKTLMESNNLDLIILSAPENIFYLTGWTIGGILLLQF